ncbi:hypothetical protein I317_05351 [Kwoniella heveanensis CBS 569]|nr:hypothetical protein I317_05351 [Kwoniella heveanensis CBS 569]
MTSRLSYDFPRYDRPQSFQSQSSPQSRSQYPTYTTAPGAPSSRPPQNSYYEPGEEEYDEPFDVRADFDGDGPRWSERHGPKPGHGLINSIGGGAAGSMKGEGSIRSGGAMGTGIAGDDRSYRPVEDHIAPSAYTDPAKSLHSREELVSVPVLGPEWKKTELHELSRRGQSELKGDKRTRAWREWTRDQRGLFGVKWLTRKVFVFIVFAFLAALGVTLYFVIPRAPSFEFYNDSPFVVNEDTVNFNRVPTNFSFAGNLNLFGDASSSYLPVHFTSLQATLYDVTTNKKIATGDWGNKHMDHKDQQPVVLPVQFEYSAVNTSDITWNNMYQACGHKWTGTTRPGERNDVPSSHTLFIS